MDSNPAIPDKSVLFDPVGDVYGSRLALVFGNEFNRGECPFYKKQCTHCDIGAGEGTQFNPELNGQRLDYFKDHYRSTLESIAHLVVYNSGSVLNRREMSEKTLKEILGYASSLEKCEVVSFDSREMFVTEENLDYIVNGLRDDQQARVILGIESQSDEVRIGKLRKNMTKEAIEKAFATIGKYNEKIGVDVNIVFQPPELTGEAAVEEAIRTVEYILNLSEKYNVPVDINFHPYYQSKKGKKEYPQHPRADLEEGVKALIKIKELIEERASDTNIFVGWQDENHDQEQEIREKELAEQKSALNQFNITQNVEVLNK